MDTVTPVNLGTSVRLKNDDFRHQFFKSMSRHETATQIRDLRLKRGKRQIDVAHEGRMGESAISRIEKSDYSGWTFNTLWKVAKALNARVRIQFEPMEEAVREFERFEASQKADQSSIGASLLAYLESNKQLSALDDASLLPDQIAMNPQMRPNITTKKLGSSQAMGDPSQRLSSGVQPMQGGIV